MTHKEYAKELVEWFAETIPPLYFLPLIERDWATAKKCALKTVEELIANSSNQIVHTGRGGMDDLRYWQTAKEEIEKM